MAWGSYGEKTTTYSPSTSNADNERKYQEILAGYRKQLGDFSGTTNKISANYAAMVKGISGVGDSQRHALDRQFAQQYAGAQQSMISRGLGNTTVLDSARRGIGYDQAQANIALADALSREKLAVQAQKQGYLAGAQGGYASLQGAMLGYQGQYRGAQQAQDAAYAGQYGLSAQQFQQELDYAQQQHSFDMEARRFEMGGPSFGTSATGSPNNIGRATYTPSAPTSRSGGVAQYAIPAQPYSGGGSYSAPAAGYGGAVAGGIAAMAAASYGPSYSGYGGGGYGGGGYDQGAFGGKNPMMPPGYEQSYVPGSYGEASGEWGPALDFGPGGGE